MASHSASFEECPLCQNPIPSENIESHVNQCFEKQAEKIQKSPALTKKRQINLSSESSKSYDIFNFNRAKKPKIEEKPAVVTKSNEPTENDDVTDIKPKPAPKPTTDYKPLAEIMRPTVFEHYVGQKQAVGENSIIRNLLNNNNVTSAIFWGPPGAFIQYELIA